MPLENKNSIRNICFNLNLRSSRSSAEEDNVDAIANIFLVFKDLRSGLKESRVAFATGTDGKMLDIIKRI